MINVINIVIFLIAKMISFKYKSLVKRIKIKTHQRLDDRMSLWLQGIFNIKQPIIGFKTTDNVYYDVESFYSRKEKFFGQQIEIVEANDQLQISFTSDNLNSSSFIRPVHSQPNTSEINHKGSSDDCDDFQMVNELNTFQSRLQKNKDLNILFNINSAFKKVISDSIGDLSAFQSFKTNFYIYINTKLPKYSMVNIYIGKTLIVQTKLDVDYKKIIKNIATNYQKSKYLLEVPQQTQPRALQQQQIDDQAPSFTTYHLQQRINQECCQDYLIKMQRQRILKHYQYVKLMEKCQENFSEFYRIFCEGIIDNDYESFKNELLLKCENNLQILLSNVDEMDLSRPISRQERRNYKRSSDIHIVKVETYEQILDALADELDPKIREQIKKYLLQENPEIFSYFSEFNSKNIDKGQLADRLRNFLTTKNDNRRPVSRCVPRNIPKNKTAQPRANQQFQTLRQNQQPPPMFGPSRQNNFSPIKYMSDIDSNYKHAWGKLQSKADSFSPEQYGLLYHYLQKRDDSISNFVQELQWDQQKSLENLKLWLRNKIKQLLNEHFTDKEISVLQDLRYTPQIDRIYQNFRYESDITTFMTELKEQLSRAVPVITKALHKKSSDSQLLVLQKKSTKPKQKRKYSDQSQGLSPKESDISLYQQKSDQQYQSIDSLNQPWANQFAEMLKVCNFPHEKQQYIRSAFREGNPGVYIWIRNYLQRRDKVMEVDSLKKDLHIRQQSSKFSAKITPIFNQILKCLVEENSITDKMRKWLIIQCMELNLTVIAIFELYIETKNEEDFLQNIRLIYEYQNQQMENYRIYLKRLEDMLCSIAIEDTISAEMFHLYPNYIKAVCEVYFITGDAAEMLDSLHQIHNVHSNLRKLNCATLNFSKYNISPFEYFDGTAPSSYRMKK